MKLIEIRHPNTLNINGTVIDLETTGLGPEDEIVTAGFLNKDGIFILQRTHSNAVQFKEGILKLIKKFERPFYAFNKEFEEGFLGINFDGELQKQEMEPAFAALKSEELLEMYNRLSDPLDGEEVTRFWNLWTKTKEPALLVKIAQHNYCCLVKELMLMLKRVENVSLDNMPYFTPSNALKHICRGALYGV